MRRIDEQYLKTPFYGWPRMTTALRTQGYAVFAHHDRLWPHLTHQAVIVRKHRANSTPGHRIYPYLLRDLEVTVTNQVWCADSTYVSYVNTSCCDCGSVTVMG